MPYFHSDINYITGYFDSDISFPHMTQSPHRVTKQFELEFFCEDCTTYLDGQPYRLQKNTVLCVMPDTVRWSDLPFRNNYLQIEDQNDDIAAFLRSIPMIFQTNRYEQYVSIINSLVRSHSTDNLWERKQLIYSLLSTLWDELSERKHISANPESDKRTVQRVRLCDLAIQYMKEHITESCSLAKLSSAAHVSPIYFHNVFKSVHGVTPLSYLTQLRLDMAKLMLQTDSEPLSVIAEACGFSSETYFSAVFKKQLGITPRQFRQQAMEQYFHTSSKDKLYLPRNDIT